MLTFKSCASKKKQAPYSKEQYEYILADLLERKQAAMSLWKKGLRYNQKPSDTDKAFNRLIDSIWKEQYAYYKK